MRFYLFFVIVFINLNVIARNTVCFSVATNPHADQTAFSGFTKYIKVLECFELYGESSITDEQMLHAAAIAAELLDNDEDGVVDDVNIYNQLVSNKALMPLFSAEASSSETLFMDNYTGDGVSAVLYAGEVDPNNPGVWGMDATVEEIMHTINHVGHVNAYPTIFGMSPNSSSMSAAMDVARGGQFLTIPSSYPSQAWYHYDDQTCDYSCMAIEYMYWSIVANMGLLDDVNICSGIANEWEPCTPSLFQTMDLHMHSLVTDDQYKIPQSAPDGNYCVTTTTEVEVLKKNKIRLFPNPSIDGIIQLEGAVNTTIKVYNESGKLVLKTISTDNVVNVSTLSSGFYIVNIDNVSLPLVVK
jgi:hypothetical protein